MEIRYSREMNHNYMIIEAPEEETGYAVQMLSANDIEGLLKFRVRQTEEAREYYYEITSRQPLRRVLEKRTLSGQELRSILLGVLAVLAIAGRFHTGQGLGFSRRTRAAFALIALATCLRVLPEMGLIPWPPGPLHAASALAWAAAFLLWLWDYWPAIRDGNTLEQLH